MPKSAIFCSFSRIAVNVPLNAKFEWKRCARVSGTSRGHASVVWPHQKQKFPMAVMTSPSAVSIGFVVNHLSTCGADGHDRHAKQKCTQHAIT